MVLGKLFRGLKKTRESLGRGLSRLFGGGRKLDADFLEELEEVLYTADLGPTGSEIVAELQEAYRRKEIAGTSCLLYTSPSPRDRTRSRMPSSA